MSDEKKYTAREAALAVLKKAEEMLKKSDDLKKTAGKESKHDRCVEHVKENSPEVKNPHAVCVAEGVNPASWGKSEKMPVGEIHPKEPQVGESEKPGDRIREQVAPNKNPKEKAEGNNELAGTTPNQVGQDGKNIMGFDEMRGHIKLAKFIGHMQSKRTQKKPGAV